MASPLSYISATAAHLRAECMKSLGFPRRFHAPGSRVNRREIVRPATDAWVAHAVCKTNSSEGVLVAALLFVNLTPSFRRQNVGTEIAAGARWFGEKEQTRENKENHMKKHLIILAAAVAFVGCAEHRGGSSNKSSTQSGSSTSTSGSMNRSSTNDWNSSGSGSKSSGSNTGTQSGSNNSTTSGSNQSVTPSSSNSSGSPSNTSGTSSGSNTGNSSNTSGANQSGANSSGSNTK
jgi:hypothetical protein